MAKIVNSWNDWDPLKRVTGGCQAAGLQELTAGDGSVHHKFPLFLFLLYKGQHRVVRCPLFPGNGQMDRFL